MKKIFLLLIIFITGCSKYTELNDLAIIKCIGISYDKEYTLYAEIIDEIDKNNLPKTKLISVKGENIEILFNEIKQVANKEIFFSHIDLLLIDHNITKNNYQEIINYFLNHYEFRNDFYVLLSKDIPTVLENAKYDEIEDLINSNKQNNNIIKISFEQIIKAYLNNEPFKLSEIGFNESIIFQENYQFINQKYERIKNEKS